MRKKVSGLILCFALLFSLPLPAFAANQVNTMDIQAVIYEDGSMYVTQVCGVPPNACTSFKVSIV